ncbi:hypothetical protein HMPREF9565_02020 [Cutibacterium acnes HL053PA2]|nr:hypothetical protein HMPREF9618_02238 [Cutibacterium acnes HL082PA1]EFT50173.1 hypothetical protein HMPREF9565_02020 [Cutibacterium acnes HL053PA2]
MLQLSPPDRSSVHRPTKNLRNGNHLGNLRGRRRETLRGLPRARHNCFTASPD